jgi:hypothetical protein
MVGDLVGWETRKFDLAGLRGPERRHGCGVRRVVDFRARSGRRRTEIHDSMADSPGSRPSPLGSGCLFRYAGGLARMLVLTWQNPDLDHLLGTSDIWSDVRGPEKMDKPPLIPHYIPVCGQNRSHAGQPTSGWAHWRAMSPLACCNPPPGHKPASRPPHAQPRPLPRPIQPIHPPTQPTPNPPRTATTRVSCSGIAASFPARSSSPEPRPTTTRTQAARSHAPTVPSLESTRNARTCLTKQTAVQQI